MRTSPPEGAYSTVAEVASPRQRALGLLTVIEGADAGLVIELGREPVTLGRADECTNTLADPDLSRVHARIVRIDREYVINDVGSTNGTFVNDEPVDFAVTLCDGDRIRLGSITILRFSLAAKTCEPASDPLPAGGEGQE